MKEKILKLLNVNRNEALSILDILKRLSDDKVTFEEVSEVLNELKLEKKVYCTDSKRGYYILNPFREGVFHIRRNGSCYVYINDLDMTIDIDKNRTYGCMENDLVLVRITDFNTKSGSIKEIIERAGIVGEIKTINKDRYAVVNDIRYKIIDCPKTLPDGMLVGVKLDKKKVGNYYTASIDRVIGHKNAPKVDDAVILYQKGFDIEFSKDTLEQLKYISTEVKEEDKKDRRDLSNEIIFTIDGADTKDIDDAISYYIKNGKKHLVVHIADVSHYVTLNSSLDLDARNRGTSVYLPGCVSPMLHAQLSNGICSLNPNEERLALSVDMEVENDGSISSYDIFLSVISSNKKMVYDDVNEILEGKIVPGYENFSDVLIKMRSLADALKRKRISSGMLEFDSSEVKIEIDDNGKVLKIVPRVQGKAEEMIEEFMLAANMTVATHLSNLGIASIYRNHDVPDYDRLKKVLNVIKSYGENLEFNVSTHDPKVIQKIISSLKETDNFSVYSSMILRCMAKADYGVYNIGHFGIGVMAKRGEAYTHFTSPIRRYPDLTVHRILKESLKGNFDYERLNNLLNEIAVHSSMMEVMADQAEREADKMRMASYMEGYIGKIFAGKIVSFTRNAMFVKLSNYVEGRVSFESMDDYYEYNEELEVVVGNRKKHIYRLGDDVQVIVVRANKEAREIDLEIAKSRIRKR